MDTTIADHADDAARRRNQIVDGIDDRPVIVPPVIVPPRGRDNDGNAMTIDGILRTLVLFVVVYMTGAQRFFTRVRTWVSIAFAGTPAIVLAGAESLVSLAFQLAVVLVVLCLALGAILSVVSGLAQWLVPTFMAWVVDPVVPDNMVNKTFLFLARLDSNIHVIKTGMIQFIDAQYGLLLMLFGSLLMMSVVINGFLMRDRVNREVQLANLYRQVALLTQAVEKNSRTIALEHAALTAAHRTQLDTTNAVGRTVRAVGRTVESVGRDIRGLDISDQVGAGFRAMVKKSGTKDIRVTFD